MIRTALATLCVGLIAACAEEHRAPADQAGGVELPEPSGPPVVQQAEPHREKPSEAEETAWSAEGGALRLMSGDKVLLTLRCNGGNLAARAETFKPIGSEDRFSLGLDDEPITLVADPTRQSGPGVTAEGPAPDNLSTLLGSARALSAVYGTQQVGPHPAPSTQAAAALAANCK
ncbi:MAG TPA: hypothetical protein VGD10_00400 [Allosphingosinicella sp.]|uniref:hypothetical protein n=1 Tax=Allosphingosinicella sp. TaxID=2823234 RepID=UPI002EDA10F4